MISSSIGNCYVIERLAYLSIHHDIIFRYGLCYVNHCTRVTWRDIPPVAQPMSPPSLPSPPPRRPRPHACFGVQAPVMQGRLTGAVRRRGALPGQRNGGHSCACSSWQPSIRQSASGRSVFFTPGFYLFVEVILESSVTSFVVCSSPLVYCCPTLVFFICGRLPPLVYCLSSSPRCREFVLVHRHR